MAPVRAAVTLARASPWARHVCSGCRSRAMSSTSTTSSTLPPPKEIAVLGAGLTGLVTAHYLAARMPATTRITVYESSKRVGGWIDSQPVVPGTDDGDGDGDVFEAGARTVAPQRRTGRYDDVLLLGLVAELGLADRLRVTRRRAAQYIYYPDHLVEVPGSGGGRGVRPSHGGGVGGGGGLLVALVEELRRLGQIVGRVLREPLFRGVLPLLGRLVLFRTPPASQLAQLHSARAAAQHPGRLPPDESVGAYALRRLGAAAPDDEGRAQAEAVVDNVLSAVVHGIYGGDVWRLSVASSPLRADWLTNALTPLYKRYALRMQYGGLAQRMWVDEGPSASASASDDPALVRATRAADVDIDAPLQRPLPPDLLAQTHVFVDGPRCLFVPASDLALLEDLLARTRGRQPGQEPHHETEPWESSSKHPWPEQDPQVDLLVRLAMASTRWTTFGFAGGFGTLTDALARALRQRPNVRFRTGAPVTAITANAGPTKLAVHTASRKDGSDTTVEQYDRVVSTLAAPTLCRLTDGALPSLQDTHAVTIMVVNLYYDEPGLNAPYHGFGYLIPQSVPLAENPEMALGVLFDSDREALLEGWEEEEEEEAPAPVPESADEVDRRPPYTKLTVLLGGHFWDDYADADFPSPDEAVALAEAVVRRHLRTTRLATARPSVTRAKLCRQCIPQHPVGHAARLAAADAELQAAFGGRLAVAGGSFTATGPGVLASVRAAYDVALRVAGRGYRHTAVPGEMPLHHVGDTGLARFGRPETDTVVPVQRRVLPLRFGNKTVRSPLTGTWTVQDAW